MTRFIAIHTNASTRKTIILDSQLRACRIKITLAMTPAVIKRKKSTSPRTSEGFIKPGYRFSLTYCAAFRKIIMPSPSSGRFLRVW